jgi:hypothetical protein
MGATLLQRLPEGSALARNESESPAGYTHNAETGEVDFNSRGLMLGSVNVLTLFGFLSAGPATRYASRLRSERLVDAEFDL